MADKEVIGGAQVETAQVQSVAPTPAADDADVPTMNVVTTAPGTFGPLGIAPVGTKAAILPSAYSEIWMKPVTPRDQGVLKRHREAAKAKAPAKDA